MATETTVTSSQAWRPDVQGFVPTDVIPDAIILQASTVAGRIEGDQPMLRVPYVDDAAATFVAEGAAIPEADPALSEAVVATGKISQLVRLSREQYTQTGTANLLSESVRRAIVTKANAAFLTQAAPTGGAVTPPAGVSLISGIVSGGAVADDLDVLVDLIATLEGNGAMPSLIIIDQGRLGQVEQVQEPGRLRPGAARCRGRGRRAQAPRPAGDRVLVHDRRQRLGRRQGRRRQRGRPGQRRHLERRVLDGSSIGLRCTWRIGWNAVHANRIGKFTVTNPA